MIMVNEKRKYTVGQIRDLYDRHWEANQQSVSDAAIEVMRRLSSESCSVFEAADFITLTPIVDEAIAKERTRCAEIAESHNGEHPEGGEYRNCGLAIALKIRNPSTGEEGNPDQG